MHASLTSQPLFGRNAIVSRLKKTLIIVTSIVVFLVVCQFSPRRGNLFPNAHGIGWIIQTNSWNRTLNDTPLTMFNLKDDHYFKTMCSNPNLAIPSVTLSQLQLEQFLDGVAEVIVHVFEPMGKRSDSKDDVIFVWAEQVNGHGRVTGIVSPRANGSYTGHIKVFWSGLVRIKAKIGESSANSCLRYKSLLHYGNVVYSKKVPWGILGVFKSPYLQEKTRCGTTPYLHGYIDMCNFTALNDGSPWYCGQPRSKTLNCHHIYSFGAGAFHVDGVKKQEQIQCEGYGTLSMSVTVDSKLSVFEKATAKCKMAPKRNTWTRTSISGFLGEVWEPLHCKGLGEHTIAAYKTCLNGKTLAFIGDSTVRQYFEYIYENIFHMSFPNHHWYGPGRDYRSTTVLSRYNITAYFRKHELPWHSPDVPPHGIKSTASQLRDLANTATPGHSLIVVLNCFTHMLAIPPSHYRQRIHTLVESVQYLLAKKPGITVLYKGPHVFKQNDRWFDQNFALLFRDILFEEFHDIMDSVVYLDTWDITIAHDNENLHPEGSCMQSQMQQMVTYICE